MLIRNTVKPKMTSQVDYSDWPVKTTTLVVTRVRTLLLGLAWLKARKLMTKSVRNMRRIFVTNCHFRRLGNWGLDFCLLTGTDGPDYCGNISVGVWL